MVVPARAPAVTNSICGAALDGLGLAGLGCRIGFGAGAARLRREVGPNKSVRTTPTAAMTNSHRTARNPILMRVSSSAFMETCVLGHDAERGARAGGIGPMPPRSLPFVGY